MVIFINNYLTDNQSGVDEIAVKKILKVVYMKGMYLGGLFTEMKRKNNQCSMNFGITEIFKCLIAILIGREI